MSRTDFAPEEFAARRRAVGEAIGAVLGIDRVTPLLWVTEVKPVTREQVAESDTQEGRRGA